MKAPKKRILVVEDDTELCNSILKVLQDNDYHPFWAADRRESIFKLRNETYALILLDMRLGADTGEDIIEFARFHKESMNDKTPILVVSGFLDQHLLKKIKGDIQGALVKPFDLTTLLNNVKKFVEPAATKPNA